MTSLLIFHDRKINPYATPVEKKQVISFIIVRLTPNASGIVNVVCFRANNVTKTVCFRRLKYQLVGIKEHKSAEREEITTAGLLFIDWVR